MQVGRQGNPLFCEALVAIIDKDRYNRTLPTVDASLFAKYALNPELAVLINKLVLGDAEGDGPIADDEPHRPRRASSFRM